MPKVSVIVPIFGTEKYIERCARSLFEQTLDDLEFIFIDDCSPDNSIDVLKRVVADYPHRKKQVHMERMPHNSGLPAVRKYGVGRATGDYIIACDSDDYVDKTIYEKMYKVAVSKNCDLVQCDISVVDDNGVVRMLTSEESAPSSEKLRRMIIDGDIANSLCNKLIKRSVYFNDAITFPVAGMDEDNTLSCQLAFFSQSLGYINEPLYFAYQNNASMSRRAGKEQVRKRFQESLDNSKIVVDFLKAHGYQDDDTAIIRAKIRPKNYLWPIVKSRMEIKEWKGVYPEINYKVFFNKRVPRNTQIKFALVLLNLVLLRH